MMTMITIADISMKAGKIFCFRMTVSPLSTSYVRFTRPEPSLYIFLVSPKSIILDVPVPPLPTAVTSAARSHIKAIPKNSKTSAPKNTPSFFLTIWP